MRLFLATAFTLSLFLGNVELFAQESRSSIQVKPDVALQASVERNLQDLIKTLESTEKLLKQKKHDEAKTQIKKTSQDLQSIIANLDKDPDYKEITLYIKRVDLSLQDVLGALDAGRESIAKNELNNALNKLRLLQSSPVLKLSVTRHAIQLANRDILSKNYSSAGIFLQQAIDVLSQLEASSKIDLKEVKSLKSDIVVAHQQVILGKAGEQKDLNQLYQRANVTTTDIFYQYYDMWTMTPTPWNKY